MSTQVQLYTPHNKQKLIHKECINDDSFFITVVAGRQGGKTLLAENQALYWSLSKPCRTWIVSPTDAQAQKIYKEILNALIPSGLIKSHKGSSGTIEINLTNGSILEFRSAASEDSLRGPSLDYLIIDEAAFIKRTTIEEILLPMLNVKGKKVLITSTPKGKNWLYDYYLLGLNDTQPKYKSFKFTSIDNPKANQELIKVFKQTMNPVMFKQEFEAEFVDSAAVFPNVDDCIGTSTNSQHYYAGIDIGLITDATVVTIINQLGEMVAIERFTNVEAPQLKKNIVEVLNRFKPKRTYIESNNQGLPIYQDLKTDHKVDNLETFNTTSKSKEEIINNLINAFAEKRIKILNNPILLEELNAFAFNWTPTGKVQFKANSGFHDDCVMSLAIAYECFLKHKSKGTFDYTFASF